MSRYFAVAVCALVLTPFFASAATQCPNLTRNLSYGSRGSDVVQLQQFLISQNLLAAGNNTGYYGALTRAAVQKFQCKQMQICSGSASSNGYGAVGPRTRASISSMCAFGIVPSPQPQPAFTQPSSMPAQPIGTSQLPACTPLSSQTQMLSCPTGQTGSITQTRTSSCPGPIWGIWTTTNNTCVAQPVAQSCTLPWGGSIASSASMPAYQSLLVPAGSQCTLETRMCNNGTLSGSYQYQNCSVQQATATTLPWSVGALVLDGVNVSQKVDAPLQEAIAFIEQHSRFRFNYTTVTSTLPHNYTHYDCAEGTGACVVVNYTDINSGTIGSLSSMDSYVLLWNTNGQPPLQTGSTWGVANGIPKNGINRPYATIPADPWWYNNDPFEGFTRRSAQIITHELINSINAKLEVAPYFCTPLTGTSGDPADKYELDRLKKLTDDCYQKLQ